MKWEQGRQNSGYAKLALWVSERFKFDVYLLRLARGVSVPEHKDPSPAGYEHHRLNITINMPCIGTGMTVILGPSKHWLNGRIIKFRPDLYTHYMTPVDTIWDKNVYILSIGWLKKKECTSCSDGV